MWPGCYELSLQLRFRGATLGRLWAAVAATYAISGITYVLVYRLVSWTKAAERTKAVTES